MDNFFRRLKYYGLGFGMGLIFVFFFFQNRGCAWFPENRVKNVILRNVLVLNESNRSHLAELDLVDSSLVQAINLGDVDFSASDKKSPTKIYVFNCKTPKEKPFTCYVSLNESTFISEIFFTKKDASKTKISKEGEGTFIHFPVKKDFVYLDSTEIADCPLQTWNFKTENQIFKAIMNTGKLDFSQSQLEKKPRPIQVITLNDSQKRPITLQAIWYKEKMQVVKVQLDYKNDCNQEKHSIDK
jgi:hypothetical protein